MANPTANRVIPINLTWNDEDGYEFYIREEENVIVTNASESGLIDRILFLATLSVHHPLNVMSARCRKANDTWWRDPITGSPIQRNKGELLGPNPL